MSDRKLLPRPQVASSNLKRSESLVTTIKHAEPIADAFALFIAAFLPPKIMQSNNGKEFKGALLILLWKYGIKIINGAPRSCYGGIVRLANYRKGRLRLHDTNLDA